VTPALRQNPTPSPAWQDAWGVVLCGGRSRRMGRDKARILLDGATLIERAVGVLGELTAEVLLASGPGPRYPELGLECVLDAGPDLGPLGGLEAALARLARADVRYAVVLACDMPHMTGTSLGRLLERARASRAGVTLVSTPAGVEPLCAVYDVAVLPAVRAALTRGERRMTSFHEGLAVERVPETELDAGCTFNLNSPAELARCSEAKA
jgi:molybdopterin-guanine dinucleotide biosynthesis protein A